jgi:predicted ATPase
MTTTQNDKKFPVDNNDRSMNWSSITDSVELTSNLPSVFGNEHLYPDSIGMGYDSILVDVVRPIPIVGRSKEISLLREAFYCLQLEESDTKNNLAMKKRVIALVHGVSGSGKTSLVEKSLRQQITSDAQGFFVSGKYEANFEIREPYAALLAAFSDLCDLTIQSADFSQRRDVIRERMGYQSAKILVKAISNLMTIWKNVEEVLDFHSDTHDHSTFLPEARESTAFATFMIACKSFLMAMSCREHPIILFLDDIQWMDDGSRQLLTYFLNDAALTNIMFVLTYRSEDQDNIYDFLQETRKLPDILDIELRNLEFNAVFNLIATMLGSTTSSVEQLSKIIASKSSGNPFHVTQFLKCIQRENLMTFNTETLIWEFDVDEIHRDVMVSEKLADLLTLRIKKLPTHVQYCLKIASLIGYRFNKELLIKVIISIQDSRIQDLSTSLSLDSVTLSLSEAMAIGFIEKIRDGYQFSHDRIQQSFVSMVDESERIHFHLKIGLVYLKYQGSESDYYAALHLHQVPNYTNTEFTRVRFAEINLNAAKYCVKIGAFMDASVFLQRGLALINPEDMWFQHFDLSYELTQMLSRVELIIGHHDSCIEKARETLIRAKTTKMKVDALLIEVECCMARNQMEETIKAANRALSILGVSMPHKITMRHVMIKLLKIKFMIGQKSDNYILSLPKMKDESMAIAVRLLLHIYLYCLLKNEDSQGLYSALLATEITLKNGLNAYAASALTIYGVAELASGNYRRAYRFGKLAISLLDKFQNREAECSTIAFSLSTLTHWYDPIREMPPILFRASNNGFEIGDVVYGSFCLCLCYGTQTLIGENLERLEVIMRSHFQKIQNLSQDAMIMWVQPALQYVSNLRTQDVMYWYDLTNLTGDVMNESIFIQESLKANHQTLIMTAWIYKAQLSYLFGEWAKAESVLQDMMQMCDAFYFTFGIIPTSLFGGLASFSLFRENGKRKHLRLAKKNQNTLKGVQRRGSPNAPVFLNLLNAEALSIKKSAKSHAVTTAYGIAIEAMAREKYPQFEALANERAGFYQIRCKNRVAAEMYFERALELYKYDWGSITKHDWLSEKVEQALSMLPTDDISRSEIPKSVIGISANV